MLPEPPKQRFKMLRKEPWREDDEEAMRIFRQWLRIRWFKAREERVKERFNSLVQKVLFRARFEFVGIFVRLTNIAVEMGLIA